MKSEPGRFLLAQASVDEEVPQYILHTQSPKVLLQLVSVSNPQLNAGKVYSYMAQNEVEPRHFTLQVVQMYEPANDCSTLLDEAWQWLNTHDVLAA